MKEVFVKGTTLPDAYHKALAKLHDEGTITACGDWNCTQKEIAMTMFVERPCEENMISKFFVGDTESLEQYRMEMLEGIMDFEVGTKWHYTYHDRMVRNPGNQIKFVVDELKREPSSRRAVIVIRDNSHDMYSENPACMQHIQYMIRDGKLDCFVLFRSNDACRATFMNAFAMIMLQKKIASEIGVEVGTYTHRANSFHCYQSNYDMLDGYYDRISSSTLEELSYPYDGGWKELMEEDRMYITRKVRMLFEKNLIEKTSGV